MLQNILEPNNDQLTFWWYFFRQIKVLLTFTKLTVIDAKSVAQVIQELFTKEDHIPRKQAIFRQKYQFCLQK